MEPAAEGRGGELCDVFEERKEGAGVMLFLDEAV